MPFIKSAMGNDSLTPGNGEYRISQKNRHHTTHQSIDTITVLPNLQTHHSFSSADSVLQNSSHDFANDFANESSTGETNDGKHGGGSGGEERIKESDEENGKSKFESTNASFDASNTFMKRGGISGAQHDLPLMSNHEQATNAQSLRGNVVVITGCLYHAASKIAMKRLLTDLPPPVLRYELTLTEFDENQLDFGVEILDADLKRNVSMPYDRILLVHERAREEEVFGLGEQFSYWGLVGTRVPVITRFVSRDDMRGKDY